MWIFKVVDLIVIDTALCRSEPTEKYHTQQPNIPVDEREEKIKLYLEFL